MSTLTIMTFNIQSGLRGDGGGLDLPGQAAVIASGNPLPDVVVLQEVNYMNKRSNGLDQAKELAALASYPFFTFGKAQDLEGGAYGNAILSKTGLFNIVNKKVDQPAGWWFPWNWTPDRAILAASTVVDGARYRIFATHFALWDAYKETHAQVLAAEVAAVNAADPVAVGGDFNADMSWPGLAPLAAVLENAFPQDSLEPSIDQVWFRCQGAIASYWKVPTNGASDHDAALNVRIWPTPLM
jgi:endonuclease/exonuclease/phosphatase family metal-dependent hydrolase